MRTSWFTRERQILATLDHPNITRMLDAGIVKEIARLPETDSGLAYFTAEVSAGLGDRAATLAALERARQLRHPPVPLRVLVDAKFDLLTPAERARLVTPPSD